MRQFLSCIAIAGLLAGCSVDPDTRISVHGESSGALASTGPQPPAARSPTAAGSRAFAALPDAGTLMAYRRDVAAVHSTAYVWHPIDISEAHALHAIGGELVMDGPDGTPIRLRYDRHIEHADGNWTWVGRRAGDPPGYEAVITFGEKAVFGSIPYANHPALRLTTTGGRAWLVETDAQAVAKLPAANPKQTDSVLPPASRSFASRTHKVAAAQSAGAELAAADSSTTVDLLLGYTTAFATRLGGQSQANTRLTYMVDVANQAYVNSQVAAQLRIVKTVQVDYPDATANKTALYDLSGFQCNDAGTCTEIAVPAALAPLHTLRGQYGADLVTLVRNFNDPENAGCGIAWLIGGGQVPIDSTDEYAGMSVVSDSSGNLYPDGGYICRDETLAHEIGHNMGSAHDRATADGDDNILQADEYGRYPYSFGYKTTSTTGNFYTVMAYGESGQTRMRIFSNPQITTCGPNGAQIYPCGVADQADNARSLRQTVPIVANFRASVSVRRIRNDMNGDGKSDLLWWNSSLGVMAYWVMNGPNFVSGFNQGIGADYVPATTGKSTGGSRTDVLMRRPADRMLFSYQSQASGFVPATVGQYDASWVIVGQGDINGDGKDDIFWRHPTLGYFAYWLMNGPVYTGGQTYTPPAAYQIAAIEDFNADGRVDIVWNDPGARQMSLWLSVGTGFSVQQIGQYGADWRLIGAADVTGDGKADLLWRNATNTFVAYWRMDGAVYMGSYALPTATDIELAATADYDGDGKSDLMWTRSSDRTMIMWISNGTNFGQYVIGQYGAGWALQP